MEQSARDLSRVEAKLKITAGCVNLRTVLGNAVAPSTQEAFEADLSEFFRGDLSQENLIRFVSQSREQLILRLGAYKEELEKRDLVSATIQRKLSSIRALIRQAHNNGRASVNGNGRGVIPAEALKQSTRRDGMNSAQVRLLLELPGTDTVRGLRDTAILRLMCGSAFRTSEIVTLNVGDFCAANGTLNLEYDGKRESLPLNSATAYLIAAYMAASGHGADASAPLFCNLDHRPGYRGKRLTAKGIQHLINSYASELGVKLSASMLRFTAIQTALAMTGGDIEKVKKFSRVSDVRSILACARQRKELLTANGKTESLSIRQRASAAVARADLELERAQRALARARSLPDISNLRGRAPHTPTQVD